MNFDLRISNGTLHTPNGELTADILVKDGVIAAIVRPGESTEPCEEIDARGRHILPGVVDLHAHTRTPGYEYKEDFYTSSQAAAIGGITTYVDMPNVEPPTDTVELFLEKKAIAQQDCIIDFGHFVSPVKLDQIPKLAEAGATGFKIFQVSGGYPHDDRLAMADADKMFPAFRDIAKTGLHCSVHPFNQKLQDHLTEVALAAGKPYTIKTFTEIYPSDIIWSSAVPVLIEFARATGVRIQLLHTHAPRTFEHLRRAKAEGIPVTAAIDAKYFHLTGEDFEAQGARCSPGGWIVEDEARMEAIWTALSDGTLDAIDSDHAPHTLEDLEGFTKDPWHGPWGSPQYEYILPLMLHDVSLGHLTLDTLVRLMSENPAKVIGRYPQKGAIQVGSDADLVIVDLERETVPADEKTYTKSGWTPYVGRTFKGYVETTLLRGNVIARDGKPTAARGTGKYLAGVPQEPTPTKSVQFSPGLNYRPIANKGI
jgi:dihydroorotase